MLQPGDRHRQAHCRGFRHRAVHRLELGREDVRQLVRARAASTFPVNKVIRAGRRRAADDGRREAPPGYRRSWPTPDRPGAAARHAGVRRRADRDRGRRRRRAPLTWAPVPGDARSARPRVSPASVLGAPAPAAHPTKSSRVTVHYSGWTTDGKLFDSSLMRGETASFGLGGRHRGLDRGVQLMVPGEKTRFWIPDGWLTRVRVTGRRACWCSTSSCCRPRSAAEDRGPRAHAVGPPWGRRSDAGWRDVPVDRSDIGLRLDLVLLRHLGAASPASRTRASRSRIAAAASAVNGAPHATASASAHRRGRYAHGSTRPQDPEPRQDLAPERDATRACCSRGRTPHRARQAGAEVVAPPVLQTHGRRR